MMYLCRIRCSVLVFVTALCVTAGLPVKLSAQQPTKKPARADNQKNNESLLDAIRRILDEQKRMNAVLNDQVRRNAQLQNDARARQAKLVKQRNLQILKQNVEKRFGQELYVLATVAGLDEDAIDELRDSTKPSVEEFVKELADEDVNRNRSLFIQPGLPPERLVKRLNAATSDTITASQFRLYREDLKARQEFQNQAAIDSIIAAIDQLAALDSQQLDAVETIFQKSWQPTWNSLAQRALMTSYPISLTLPVRELKKVLTPDQIQAVDALTNTARRTQIYRTVTGRGKGAIEKKQAEQFLEELESSMALRIRALDREFSLSEKQLKKLKVLGKGIASDVVRLRTAAMEDRKKVTANRRAAAANGVAFQIDMRLAQVLNSRPGALLLDQPRWAHHRDQVLTDEQQAVWNRLQLRLDEHAQRAMTNGYLCNLDRQMGMSGRQLEEVSELCLTAARPLEGARRYTYERYFNLLDVPAADYQRILNQDQYFYLTRVLDSLGRRRQMMDQADRQRRAVKQKAAEGKAAAAVR